jgi:hypothetical protein
MVSWARPHPSILPASTAEPHGTRNDAQSGIAASRSNWTVAH